MIFDSYHPCHTWYLEPRVDLVYILGLQVTRHESTRVDEVGTSRALLIGWSFHNCREYRHS
jgi:hypothetical protein